MNFHLDYKICFAFYGPFHCQSRAGFIPSSLLLIHEEVVPNDGRASVHSPGNARLLAGVAPGRLGCIRGEVAGLLAPAGWLICVGADREIGNGMDGGPVQYGKPKLVYHTLLSCAGTKQGQVGADLVVDVPPAASGGLWTSPGLQRKLVGSGGGSDLLPRRANPLPPSRSRSARRKLVSRHRRVRAGQPPVYRFLRPITTLGGVL